MNQTLIKNGLLVGPDSVKSGDIAIKDGKIIATGVLNLGSEEGSRIIDKRKICSPRWI